MNDKQYRKTLYGIGYMGLMKDGSKPIACINRKCTREYNIWRAMMGRCYSNKVHLKEPSYEDCEVCERWHCYANFLEDLPLIEGYELWLNNDDYCLDKDIKGNNSKLYCLDNCCFISRSDNAKERIDRCGNSFKKEEIKVYGINIKTGEQTKYFNSVREASRETGIDKSSISKCINKKLKSSGGYYWYVLK